MPAPPAPVGVPGWWNFEGFCSACWNPRPLCVSAWMTTGVPSCGDVLGARQRLLELLEVVAVDGADVVEPELVPDQVGEEEAFDRALQLARELPRLVALGQPLEEAVARVDELLVGRVELEAVAPVGEPADVLGDRPAVVVQDDDQALGLDVDDVVQRLVRRARGQRAVADDDDDVGVVGLGPGAPSRRRGRRRGPSRRGPRRGCRGRSRTARRSPESPPGVRIDGNWSRRPVTSLWV